MTKDLLPDSKYPEDVNGIIQEWLAGDAEKRKKFFCWLDKLSETKIRDTLRAIVDGCE